MSIPGKVVRSLKRNGLRGSAAASFRAVGDSLAAKLPPKDVGQRLEPVPRDYLQWLTFAVPGMLTWTNVDAMAYALRNLPDATSAVVEIGSFCGLSTCILAFLREKYGVHNPFFTSDRWAFEGQNLGALIGDSKTITHEVYREFVRGSFLRNTGTFCGADIPHTIELDSDDFFVAWEKRESRTDVFGREVTLGGPIGFNFIDGNHTYEFAKRDFENTDRYLVPGGFVLFDDSGDGSSWGVCQVIEEIKAAGKYEIITHNPNYLVRKKT